MTSMQEWFGKRVRCIRGIRDMGLREGEIYTVAARLEELYLLQPDCLPPGDNLRIAKIDGAQTVKFIVPKFLLVELKGQFLIDVNRFELVSIH